MAAPRSRAARRNREVQPRAAADKGSVAGAGRLTPVYRRPNRHVESDLRSRSRGATAECFYNSFFAWGGERMPAEACSHIKAVTTVQTAKRRECEECVKIGARWVHLRTCQTCGTTRCCDSSPNKHASKHARETSHAVIASAEPGERWLYCYPDDAFAE